MLDPSAPPRPPFLFEHHFFAGDHADVTGLTNALEDKGFQIDTFAYNPDSVERMWTLISLKVDFLEERRVLSMSDDMDLLAREYDCEYDGWLTRVET